MEVIITESINVRPVPVIFAEGRIVEIDLGETGIDLLEEVRSLPEFDGNPLSLKFVGKDGHFIKIIDYRQKAQVVFDQNPSNIILFLEAWSNIVPCLGTMRYGSCQYVALADIGGKSDMIDDGREFHFLIRDNEEKKKEFVVSSDHGRRAVHASTGICFAQRRPFKIDELAA